MVQVRLSLTSPDGLPVGWADVVEEEPLPYAALTRADGVALEAFTDAVTSQLVGHLVGTRDNEVAATLLAAGGEEISHRLVMVLDLDNAVAAEVLPDGYSVADIVADAGRYAELYVRAYHPAHPDHDPAETKPADAVPTIGGYLDGTAVGLLDVTASVELTAPDGEVVAVAIVNQLSHRVYEGPWLTEFVVAPDHQGRRLGTAMLGEVVRRLADGGESTLGLAVSNANPARRLYERLGFSDIDEAWEIAIAP